MKKISIVGLIILTFLIIKGVVMLSSIKFITLTLFYGPAMQEFPKPTGSYGAGITSYHWIDETRQEFHKKEPMSHEIMVNVWYPTDDKTDQEIPYRAQKIVEEQKVWKKALPLIPSFIWDRYSSAYSYAKPHAPLSEKQKRYPLIIFSPGYGVGADQYAVFLEELASYGYIIAGLEHPYISPLIIFPDKRVVKLDDSEILDPQISWEEREKITEKDVLTCKDDIIFVLNKLKDLVIEEASFFHNRINLENVGACGHSLGE